MRGRVQLYIFRRKQILCGGIIIGIWMREEVLVLKTGSVFKYRSPSLSSIISLNVVGNLTHCASFYHLECSKWPSPPCFL